LSTSKEEKIDKNADKLDSQLNNESRLIEMGEHTEKNFFQEQASKKNKGKANKKNKKEKNVQEKNLEKDSERYN